mmetsp:Transcript_46369/g.77156  ORF Transcript_46369/g.77156 Transcript_46369/m.77156 type:complete len:111 (-) Transcript_46369:220-552(-)
MTSVKITKDDIPANQSSVPNTTPNANPIAMSTTPTKSHACQRFVPPSSISPSPSRSSALTTDVQQQAHSPSMHHLGKTLLRSLAGNTANKRRLNTRTTPSVANTEPIVLA